MWTRLPTLTSGNVFSLFSRSLQKDKVFRNLGVFSVLARLTLASASCFFPFLTFMLSPLGPVKMGTLPEEDFSRFHHRFR